MMRTDKQMDEQTRSGASGTLLREWVTAVRALLHGLFEGPSRDAALRGRLEAMAARYGAARLHRWLAHVDPDSAARIEAADRVRVVRALEVFHKTGRPLSRHHHAGAEPLRGYDVRLLGLAPSREALRAAERK